MMMSKSSGSGIAQTGVSASARVLAPRPRRGDRALVHRELAGAGARVRLDPRIRRRPGRSRQQWHDAAVDGDLGGRRGQDGVRARKLRARSCGARAPRVRWLKRLARFGVELCGIENGSLLLAEAGLLNGHEVAVHWDNLLGFQEHYRERAPSPSSTAARARRHAARAPPRSST